MDAVEPHWDEIRTFVIDSAQQFKPVPPTPFSRDKSSQFYKDAFLVYETGKNLTEEQRAIASFWDCNPFVMNVKGHVMFATKKISPGGHWINITRLACTVTKADMVKSAEAYARVSLSLADAFISCWEEKYRSKLVRPETYINQNINEDWVPLLQTPPFPEYTSGHSVISSSAATALTGLFGDNFFQFIVFPNSGWTPDTFSIAENAHQADVRTAAILNSTDPNLRPFKSHGGKLIQYVGWADSAISPQSDIDYHKAVTDVMGGPKETGEFYRLFMVPGMAHCGGGPGANAFGQGTNGPHPSDPGSDILSALDHWVELRVAPEKIIATKYVNDDRTQGVAFQRPLCPFPKIAKYKGQGGSTTEASSFECSRDNSDDGHDHDHDHQAENR